MDVLAGCSKITCPFDLDSIANLLLVMCYTWRGRKIPQRHNDAQQCRPIQWSLAQVVCIIHNVFMDFFSPLHRIFYFINHSNYYLGVWILDGVLMARLGGIICWCTSVMRYLIITHILDCVIMMLDGWCLGFNEINKHNLIGKEFFSFFCLIFHWRWQMTGLGGEDKTFIFIFKYDFRQGQLTSYFVIWIYVAK